MFRPRSNNTNKLSPQERLCRDKEPDSVQIIQINLALKNGVDLWADELPVQIIQINLALKNPPRQIFKCNIVQIIQINLALKNAWQGWILLHPVQIIQINLALKNLRTKSSPIIKFK